MPLQIQCALDFVLSRCVCVFITAAHTTVIRTPPEHWLFVSTGKMEEERVLLAAQPSRRRMPVVLGSVVVLLLGACAMAAVVWHQRLLVLGPVELAASKPWGIDFDIRYARGERQWQITNLVLHPPAPPPAAGKAPPMVMTKATFPYYELQAMNKADAKVKEKLADPEVDPAAKEAMEAGVASNSGALESAIGCAEGSQPGSSIKTACPGMGSGKPQVVKRQWNMGFPPQVGAAAQGAAAFKRRGLTGGDLDRGQTD